MCTKVERLPLKAQASYYGIFVTLFEWFQYFISVFWRDQFFAIDYLSFWASLFR